jgi:FdrA protein
MTAIRTEVRQGAYFDSIILMQLQVGMVAIEGVEDAGAVMGTRANKALLEEADLLTPEAAASGQDDLIFVVRADTAEQAQAGMDAIDTILNNRQRRTGQSFHPKSLNSAADSAPEASTVIISVPGRYAFGVAREALELGRHAFIFSDNVSIEDEKTLKQTARSRGLLVMGPDCGTGILGGAGLGFANRVRSGRIGVIGASGTGLQAVTAAIHELGSGVSQAVGTGGRDLKAEIGAITTHQSLDYFAADPETDVVVLISKPPQAAVAADVLRHASQLKKPVVVNFIGYPPPGEKIGNLHFVASLQGAAALSVELVNSGVKTPPLEPGFRLPAHKRLRGLFSGGTLAYEAVLGLQNFLHPLFTNVPIHPDQRISDVTRSKEHTVLDLGEDDFTVGRLHPMMDNDLRIRRMRQEAADPDTGLMLIDVVLGEGSHPDPAAELGPVIRDIAAAVPVIALVIGTGDDPQDTAAQCEALVAAGAIVVRSVNAATELIAAALELTAEQTYPVPELPAPFAAINVGLETFAESLTSQEFAATHVDWRPPAGGNQKMMDILAQLKAN